jgi:hypothetical protein
MTDFSLNVLAHAPDPEAVEITNDNSHENRFGVACGCDPMAELKSHGDSSDEESVLTSFHASDLYFLNSEMKRCMTTPEDYLRHIHLAHLNRCTFVREGDFAVQPYYICNDCGYYACVLCALACHKGHNLSVTMQGEFYCDCGASENQHKCKFLCENEEMGNNDEF